MVPTNKLSSALAEASWIEYRALVVTSLDTLADDVKMLEDQLKAFQIEVTRSLATLKEDARWSGAIFGALIGAVVSVLMSLIIGKLQGR